jgi:hypothetical protein
MTPIGLVADTLGASTPSGPGAGGVGAVVVVEVGGVADTDGVAVVDEPTGVGQPAVNVASDADRAQCGASERGRQTRRASSKATSEMTTTFCELLMVE